MRELTKKQKELLTKWFKENEPTEEERALLGKTNELRGFMDLTTEQINILEEINDTEVLSQNINSFLHDLIFK